MKLRRFSLMFLTAVSIGLGGCCSPNCWKRPSGPVGPTYTPAPLVPAAGPQPSPLPPRFTAPPPVGANPPYLPSSPSAPPPAPPPSSVQGSYSIPIPPEPNWRASTDPGVRLSPPETPPQEKPVESARLPQGQTAEPPAAPTPPAAAVPPAASIPPAASVPSPPRMPEATDTEGTPALPVDIPHFAQAEPRIASGQQPFPDGVAWLQANGYKGVLHVHKPGEDETAARRQFEKRGLKYLSLTVSPSDLNRAVVDEFNKIAADETNLPLFVYDQNGALAGGLWYLHYRLVDKLGDEKARAEAGRLGFKEDRDDEHRTMWIAVQNYLKNAAGN